MFLWSFHIRLFFPFLKFCFLLAFSNLNSLSLVCLCVLHSCFPSSHLLLCPASCDVKAKHPPLCSGCWQPGLAKDLEMWGESNFDTKSCGLPRSGPWKSGCCGETQTRPLSKGSWSEAVRRSCLGCRSRLTTTPLGLSGRFVIRNCSDGRQTVHILRCLNHTYSIYHLNH